MGSYHWFNYQSMHSYTFLAVSLIEKTIHTMEIIHIVLGKANPDRMNGVNKVVYQLATRQSASGKKVSVWGITSSPEHNYGNRNFDTFLYKAYKNPFWVDESLIADLKNKKGKAIVHLHGGWIPAFATLSKILSQLHIPFVLTPHGAYNTIAMKRSSWLKKVYFFLYEKQLLKQASKIHCIGESEVEGLQRIFTTNKTFLLPYGFEFTNTDIERQIHDRKFIIGFVGRLDIYTKGLDLLLQAFADLNYDYPHTILWIVGDSEERKHLEEMIIENHLENRVILWGSKFGKEKDELMKQMDVFVHPSRNEGLPSAVLQWAFLALYQKQQT
jgi:glycosyltransferase involved in cell wall biosynthesis